MTIPLFHGDGHCVLLYESAIYKTRFACWFCLFVFFLKFWTHFKNYFVIRSDNLKKGIEIDEQELAERCAKGERPAMKELYSRYAARLSALCSRYSDGPTEGMDIMHDTMVKVFRKIGMYRYNGEGSLYSWLSRLAVNTAIDRLRKEGRLRVISFREDFPESEEAEQNEIISVPGPEIRSMIRKLPETKRIIFNMFCIEGFSHKEIAERLGITERASTSILAKAKKSLAVMVKEYLKKMT